MERKNFKVWIQMTGVFFVLCWVSGCTPYAERKAAMESHWEKSSARARLPLVEEYIEQGNLKEAHKLLLKCLASDPELGEAHLLLGRVFLAGGRADEAEAAFRRTVELNDQLDEAWFALGIMAQDAEAYDDAARNYRRALELQPLKVDYILRMVYLYDLREQTAEAEELLENSLQKLPGRAELLTAQAEMYQRRGLYPQAIDLLEQALLQGGDNPQILESLGICYMAQQQWQEAGKIFEKLLRYDERKASGTIQQWAALCALNAGQYSRALKFYDRLSVNRREDPQLWLEMGQAALGAELYDRAQYCAEKALQYQPGWAEAQAVQGCAYYMQKKYTQATDVFETLNRDENWASFGWYMTGRCYQQLGQISKAQQAFDRASAMRPDSPLMKMLPMGPGKNL